jgi:hypothetical protein
MTVTATDAVITGSGDEVRVPLTGKPHAAFLLQAL